VGQVSVVELLTLQVVAVLSGPQVAGLDAAGLKELLVGHAEGLADGLGYDLGLDGGHTSRFVKHIIPSFLNLHLNAN